MWNKRAFPLNLGLMGLGLWVALIGFTPDAVAHRANTALSEISFNPQNKNWEIVHRFHAHDLADVMQFNTDMQEMISDKTYLRSLALQIYDEFRLFAIGDALDPPIPITPIFIGAEIEGEYLYAYFEFSDASLAKADSLIIDNALLMASYAKQNNLVTISNGSNRDSRFFTSNKKQANFSIPRPQASIH